MMMIVYHIKFEKHWLKFQTYYLAATEELKEAIAFSTLEEAQIITAGFKPESSAEIVGTSLTRDNVFQLVSPRCISCMHWSNVGCSFGSPYARASHGPIDGCSLHHKFEAWTKLFSEINRIRLGEVG